MEVNVLLDIPPPEWVWSGAHRQRVCVSGVHPVSKVNGTYVVCLRLLEQHMRAFSGPTALVSRMISVCAFTSHSTDLNRLIIPLADKGLCHLNINTCRFEATAEMNDLSFCLNLQGEDRYFMLKLKILKVNIKTYNMNGRCLNKHSHRREHK